MAKSCIYCKTPLNEDSVVDVCTRCGIGVWGEKMFAAIIENMQGAREKGDLYQGSVTDASSQNSQPKPKNTAISTMAQEAIQTQESASREEDRQILYETSKPTREDIPSLIPESNPEPQQETLDSSSEIQLENAQPASAFIDRY